MIGPKESCWNSIFGDSIAKTVLLLRLHTWKAVERWRWGDALGVHTTHDLSPPAVHITLESALIGVRFGRGYACIRQTRAAVAPKGQPLIRIKLRDNPMC